MAAGKWGCTFKNQTGGVGERGTDSCTGEGTGGRAAHFFFLVLEVAAHVCTAGGIASGAKGLLDQPV